VAGEPRARDELDLVCGENGRSVRDERCDDGRLVAAPVIGNPANHARAVPLTFEQFRYGFANAISEGRGAAITAWGIPDASKLNRLAGITQPTFVANGDNDTMMHTENSYLLAEHLPNAQLLIYPDANHGFLDQYPELFGGHVRAFLNG